MHWTILLPFYLGGAAVFQGFLNRHIAKSWGLPGTIFLNNSVIFVVGFTFFLISRLYSDVIPEVFRDRNSFSSFQWWYLLPGLFGFSLVSGIPYAIAKDGLLKVFLGIIGTQLLVSLLLDAFAEGKPVSLVRVVGAVMAFVGALLVFKES